MSSIRSRPPMRTGSSLAQGPRPSSTRPGTSLSTSAADPHDEKWIIAVLESRGVGREVGLAAINIEFGKVIVAQYTDSSKYVKTIQFCQTHKPSQIILPQSALATAPVPVNKPQKNSNIVFLTEGRASGHPGGYECLTRLMIRDDRRIGTVLAVRSKYYALAAVSALFKHVERSVALRPASLSIQFQPALGTCLIDTESVKNIELVSNLLNKNSKQHLFGLLNSCHTPMASRLLRSLIVSPPTDSVLIDGRLDVVEELCNSEQRLKAINDALAPLKSLDCDKLIGQLIQPKSFSSSGGVTKLLTKRDPAKDAETKISRLLSLRTLLKSLPGLRSALHGSDSQLLKDVSKALCEPKVDSMLETMADTLNEDAVNAQQKGAALSRNRRIYAVKAEKKLLLDVARETYKEGVSDAYNFCENLKNEHSLETMNLVATGSGNLAQFVFQCTKAEVDEREGGLPKCFMNVTRRGKNIEFSCPDLVKQNARIKDSIEEIFILSDEILEQVLVGIRADIACLYRISESIAILDVLSCFAKISSSANYVRPEWTDTLAIKAGRHPVQERFQHADNDFVPNDTYANDASSFQIITGANMSGKTTHLQQIALLQVMAQIGCFIPAEYASIRIVDAILTRLGNDDSIEASLSTFAQEMSTMAMILGALETSERSLVIVDELGRGTSPEEGVGVAHAIAEEIIKAKELCTTLSRYPNVVCLHLTAEMLPTARNSEFALEYRHRVMDGATPLTHYGLELAKLAALPTDVLTRAKQASTKLSDLAAQANSRSEGGKRNARRHELLQLRVALKDLHDSKANAMTAIEMLAKARELQVHILDVLTETAPEEDESEVVNQVEGEQTMDQDEDHRSQEV
ncbi:hypothetical protein ACM66B_006041 [Microbotryomycetes sp. NB124-2]